MRKAGLAFAFIIGVFLAAPPTLSADECYVNTFRSLRYFPDCGCTACAGTALTNCTECTDGNGNWCQTTSTQQHCTPWVNNW
jgi:hypothetical protein